MAGLAPPWNDDILDMCRTMGLEGVPYPQLTPTGRAMVYLIVYHSFVRNKIRLIMQVHAAALEAARQPNQVDMDAAWQQMARNYLVKVNIRNPPLFIRDYRLKPRVQAPPQ